jgi:hypothetical protein
VSLRIVDQAIAPPTAINVAQTTNALLNPALKAAGSA